MTLSVNLGLFSQRGGLIMIKQKQFDCVKMKWEIQQQIEKEFAKLSEKEAHKIQMGKVLKNDILGAFMKKVYAAKQGVSVYQR